MALTTSTQSDGTTIMKLVGRMDIDPSGYIDVTSIVDTAKEGVFLIIDLSGVEFMSSMGIGSLVRVAATVRRSGGNIVLLNPQPMVRLVLEKTWIPKVISVYDSIEAARTALISQRDKTS